MWTQRLVCRTAQGSLQLLRPTSYQKTCPSAWYPSSRHSTDPTPPVCPHWLSAVVSLTAAARRSILLTSIVPISDLPLQECKFTVMDIDADMLIQHTVNPFTPLFSTRRSDTSRH